MKVETKIILNKITLSSEFNHIQVAEQRFVTIDGQEEAIGKLHRRVIHCGEYDEAKAAGLDKVYNLAELWNEKTLEKWLLEDQK